MSASQPRMIAVMNQTHDVGKTFITANLAIALTQQGKSVLLIDMDPQADLSRSFGVPADEAGLDRLFSGDLSLESLMLPVAEGLQLIAAGSQLGAFDLQPQKRIADGQRLLKQLQQADLSGFDIILLDCAAVSGLLGMNAVLTASDVLIPVMAEPTAMEGMMNMLPVIRRVSRLREHSLRVWLCLNRLPRGSDFADRMASTLSQYFPKRLLRTLIFEEDAALTTVYQSLATDLLTGRTA